MKNRSPRKVSAKWIPFFCLSFFLFGMLLTSNGRFVLSLPLIHGFICMIDLYVGFLFRGVFDLNHPLGLFLFYEIVDWNNVAGFGRRSNWIHALFPGYNTNSNNSIAFLKASIRIR